MDFAVMVVTLLQAAQRSNINEKLIMHFHGYKEDIEHVEIPACGGTVFEERSGVEESTEHQWSELEKSKSSVSGNGVPYFLLKGDDQCAKHTET